MRRFLRRVDRALSSLKLTVGLLVVLAGVFILSTFIPQKSLLKYELYTQWQADNPALVWVLEVLGLTNIFLSPITIGLWVLFFSNLGVVMYRRLPSIKKRIRLERQKLTDPQRARAYKAKGELELPDDATLDRVRGWLERRHYDVLAEGDRLYAVRYRRSPIATLGFHLSFFIIMLGGVTAYYTSFAGEVDLGEGEVFEGIHADYRPGPRMPVIGGLPAERFLVEKIEPEIEGWTPTGVTITIRDPDGERHAIEINRPYDPSTSSFGFQNLGMAPLFILTDSLGNELEGAYVRLDVLNEKEDELTLAGHTFLVKFYPDFAIVDGLVGTQSREFNNPVFRVKPISEEMGPDHADMRNGSMAIFGNYRLILKDVRYWVRLFVRKQSGLGVVWAGFGIGTLCLIIRLYFYRREYVARLFKDDGGTRLALAGRSEFYEVLFAEEFERTLAAMREELVVAAGEA